MRLFTPLRVGLVVLGVLGFVMVGAGMPFLARAATTINVTTTTDELNHNGQCSLREAIQAANTDTAVDSCSAGNGADTILLPAFTYVLNIPGRDEDGNQTGDLDIKQDVTIASAAASQATIDGNQADRVFDIRGANAPNVRFERLSIRNGNPGTNASVPTEGGGIRANGTIMLVDTSMLSNTAELGGAVSTRKSFRANTGSFLYNKATTGGAFYVVGYARLDNSLISGNAASAAGGALSTCEKVELHNTTLSENTANTSGGAINTFTCRNTTGATVSLNNVTLAFNTADADTNGSGDGGGIYNPKGTLTATNSIIGENTDNGGQAPDCAGTLTTQGFDLLQSTRGCTLAGTATGNKTGVDPMLGILGDGGGPTNVHAPLIGSPALDAGNPTLPGGGGTACEAADQRGVPRPQDGDGDGKEVCDMGAVELQGSNPSLYVQDDFARTVSNGWGSVTPGGKYVLRGVATDFLVNGTGTMTLSTVTDNRAAYLDHVAADDVDGVMRVRTDKVAQGGSEEVYFIARRISNGNQYMGRLRLPQDGTVRLSGAGTVNNIETFLGLETQVKGVMHIAGQWLWVRTQVVGVNPTTIRMRAWADGTPEPSGWQFTTTDTTESLQAPGGVGVQAYLSAGVTNVPVQFEFDDLLVQTGP